MGLWKSIVRVAAVVVGLSRDRNRDGRTQSMPESAPVNFWAGEEQFKQRIAALEGQIAELRKIRQVSVEEEKAIIEKERAEARRKELEEYKLPAFLSAHADSINIAVGGQTGSGKSTLINIVLGKKASDGDRAPMGTTETTRDPTPYRLCPEHPAAASTTLWDLPGGGTTKWPVATYVQDLGLRFFGVVLLVTARTFTDVDLAVFKECLRCNIKVVVVRQKINAVVKDAASRGADPREECERIRDGLIAQLGNAAREMQKSWSGRVHLLGFERHLLYDTAAVQMAGIPNATPDYLNAEWANMEGDIAAALRSAYPGFEHADATAAAAAPGASSRGGGTATVS